MAVAGSGLKLGFVEPHLGRVGGIRRVVEFANRLVARGHEVAFLLPDGEVLGCSWMPCAARVVPLSVAVGESWDVVVFNHEPQWFWLERFSGARRRVFYALHDGSLYGKEGSWEAAWAPVDVQLANSRWTAERIAGVHGGVVPLVQLGGVNREVFSPWEVPKRHRVLCSGVTKSWKGTDTIREACASLGVPLGEYAPLDLSQEALGREYASAEVFVVGSWYEGFCQPGLEALACGVPLVTTDNGGCREYAIDGETALVVPPRDAGAMAEAIGRLLDDRVFAQRLAANGLELVARDFDWERRTDELEERLDGVVAGSVSAPPPPRPAPPECPELSVVVLAWDNLLYTQRFAQTVRANTEVGYELIIVDNGSASEPASYASQAADVAIMNDTNLGFAKGMNQGLVAARGEWVAFCNNDTLLPEGWAAMLLETARAHPEAGIIVPALTAARNPVTVRDAPGDTVEVIDRFSAPPAAVIYLMRRDVAEALAGWGEDYEVASGEDVDLAFKVWTNDLEIVYDSRVLVDHIGKGSASRLDNWQELWAKNRQYFLTKWQDPATEIPRIASCSPERHATNQATARATAGWMQRFFTLRDRRGGGPAPAAVPATQQQAEQGLAALVADTAEAEAAPSLVRAPDGGVYLVDGGHRRRVASGLLAAGLTELLGGQRDVDASELDRWAETTPLEVYQDDAGPPFVVLAGVRHPLRGLPVPRPVDGDAVIDLADGPELDVAAANIARHRLASALAGEAEARSAAAEATKAAARSTAEAEARARAEAEGAARAEAGAKAVGEAPRRARSGGGASLPAGSAGRAMLTQPNDDVVEETEVPGANPTSEERKAQRRAATDIDRLVGAEAGPSQLVRTRDGVVYVIEGGRRRRVSAALLAPPLAGVLGPARPVEDAELARWPEGAQVVALRIASGPPFVIVGGRRLPLKGLPLPAAMDAKAAAALPVGEVIRVGHRTEIPPSLPGGAGLVRTPAGTVYVVEGRERRTIRSGLLGAAMAAHLGAPLAVDEGALSRWTDAGRFDVRVAGDLQPFVVVDGVRHPLSGLPVAVPVEASAVADFPPGPELDVSHVGRVARPATGKAPLPRRMFGRVRRATPRALRKPLRPLRRAQRRMMRRG